MGNKPAVHVRIVWDQHERSGEAVEAVGEALRRIHESQKMLDGGAHFTLNVTHEVEADDGQ